MKRENIITVLILARKFLHAVSKVSLRPIAIINCPSNIFRIRLAAIVCKWILKRQRIVVFNRRRFNIREYRYFALIRRYHNFGLTFRLRAKRNP